MGALFFLIIYLVSLLPHLAYGTVSITVSPSVLTKSNRTITIQWSGITSPSRLDWVGIYSPPDSRDSHFIGYVLLSDVSPTWRTGSGSVSLPLVNLRSDYQFRIFRWTEEEVDTKRHDHDHNPLPGTRHRLAVSDRVRFAGASAPEQIHLAYADEVDSMRLMFITGDKSECFVKFGLDSENLDRTVKTEIRRYEKSDMCASPANSSYGWRDPGFIHDGLMTGLQDGKKYYYKVGSDAVGWSEVYSFMSRDDNANETIAFLFGDMGTATPYSTFYRTQDESVSTVKWILRDIEAFGDKPALVSHIGDISYARGFSWIWDEFFNLVEPIASKVPYHVCIGNHEYDWPSQPWRPGWSWGAYGTDGGGECGVPYSLKFKMPGNSSQATGTGAPNTQNLYYSFDAGVVHFLYISTETNFLKGSEQYNFIKADLESVNRERTPFVVVQGHRPMYTTSNEVQDAPLSERMRAHLEPLLVENNVTLALWGHVHRYERFCPMRNYTCVDSSSGSHPVGAPVHAVIGMAGQDWQAIWKPRPEHTDMPVFPQPAQSMYRGGEFGYTRLVATQEKLTLAYIGNHDGEMHDMVVIFSGLTAKSGSQTEANPTAANVDHEVVPKGVLQRYVKAGSILILGAFVGYVIGFVTRYRRDAAARNAWTPVKSEET